MPNAGELILKALHTGDTLGVPLPDSPHAVSMSLPRWRDVVGYEEKDPEVTSRLQTGYPRFVIHPLVKQVAEALAPGRPCLPFPSARSAAHAATYIMRVTGEPTETLSREKIWGVATSRGGAQALKDFWQHTGLIVSTRQAQAWLGGSPRDLLGDPVRDHLRRELASLYDCAPEDVFLAPSGMAAQHEALRALMTRSPRRPTAQLGFPYVDTLKLQQKLGHGGILLHDLAHIESALGELLRRQPLAGCFGEIPGNPLLGSADLRRIVPLLRQYRVPLVADDVVATPLNVDLGNYADLIATSLTKFIVGTAEAMGGALICNPRSPYYPELRSILDAQHEELLWWEDARVLGEQARGFPTRMREHNANGLEIAERLRRHPGIERVWYPKWEFNEAYEAVRRPSGGYGALVTFLPKNAESASPRIFDRLPICKGPSLGTVFTLACPFTLLAHYTELDWAESCGVSRYLIRLSVGLEEPSELWSRLAPALDP